MSVQGRTDETTSGPAPAGPGLDATPDLNSGDSITPETGIVEVHLRELSQLFESLDPSPFHERDLDPDAEEWIVESVKELPKRTEWALLLHVDRAAGFPDGGRGVGDAIRVYFVRRAQVLRRQLRQLIRRGLVSLGIGLAFLAAVFAAAHTVRQATGDTAPARLLSEGLMIVGWVAMWRPLEIFLYDWWPIVGTRRLYDQLSRIRVRVIYKGPEPAAPPAESRKQP